MRNRFKLRCQSTALFGFNSPVQKKQVRAGIESKAFTTNGGSEQLNRSACLRRKKGLLTFFIAVHSPAAEIP
jgi:hypothetical protein